MTSHASQDEWNSVRNGISGLSLEPGVEEEDPDTDTDTDTVINGYRLLGQLGEGAFGEVRLCEDIEKKKEEEKKEKGKSGEVVVESKDFTFAMKCLKVSLLKKKKDVQRQGRKMVVVSTAYDDVCREIAIMKKMEHPNIVKLIDVIDDEEEDMLYVLMELVKGGQVMYWNHEIMRYRPNPKLNLDAEVFPETIAKRIMRGVVSGLKYIHGQRIVHCDLKPENLLLTSTDPEQMECKIADFGVSRVFQTLELEEDEENGALSKAAESTSQASPPRVKKMVGTYEFQAPECLTGEFFDPFKSDLWALGITMHALLFGSVPFYKDNPIDLFDAIEKEEVKLPPRFNSNSGSGSNSNSNSDSVTGGASSLSPNVSESAIKVLSTLLDKNPETRASIETLAAYEWLRHGLESKTSWAPMEKEDVHVTSQEIEDAVSKVTVDFAQTAKLKIRASKWKTNAQASLAQKQKQKSQAFMSNNSSSSSLSNSSSTASSPHSLKKVRKPLFSEREEDQQEEQEEGKGSTSLQPSAGVAASRLRGHETRQQDSQNHARKSSENNQGYGCKTQ